MMHSYSPSSRQLAVPGIGFPQNFFGGLNVIDLAAFRPAAGASFSKGREPPSEAARTDDLPPQLMACCVAAFVFIALVLGPAVTWLVLRAAAIAS
jgi:hypothetical protein